jgi:microcystin-dependent protein
MSEPFIAEIRIVAINFAPRGWPFVMGNSCLLPKIQRCLA